MSSLDRILPFLRPIEDLLRDPHITEVMVNAGGAHVFVERDGTLEPVPERTLEPRNLSVAIKNIARACGVETRDGTWQAWIEFVPLGDGEPSDEPEGEDRQGQRGEQNDAREQKDEPSARIAGYERAFVRPGHVAINLHHAAKALGAAWLSPPIWGLASVAAWQLPTPWPWPSGSPSLSALASVYLLLPRQECRLFPNHIRYSEDPHRRIESKQCGQPSYSMRRGSQ